MDKTKLIAGTFLFGSLWGFSEVIIGSYLHDSFLPAGAIMTGIFAIGLMVTSRMFYKQRGMQAGMGLIAGTLRLFDPCSVCFICSAIAIMAEGAIFELIWYKMSLDLKELKTTTMTISMGIISSYVCFVGGYIVTQIMTPLLSSAGFYLENLIAFIPQMLARGLIAAMIGGAVVPTIFLLRSFDIASVKDKVYYPVTATVSLVCWVIVIYNAVFILKIF